MPKSEQPRVLPSFIFSDRLSPLPEDRKGKVIFDVRASKKQEHDWRTEIRRRFRDAVENPIVLSDYSFAAHQDLADQGLPGVDDASWREGPLKTLSPKSPAVVVGHDRSFGLLYIPGFLRGPSLVNFTEATETHVPMDLPPPKSVEELLSLPQSKPVPARHAGDVDRFELGCVGCKHYGLWHACGHQYTYTSEPTRDTTGSKSNIQWTSRMRFLDAMKPVDDRVNYLTWLARPNLFDAIVKARRAANDHPGFAPLDRVWHTPYLGRAVTFNRETGEHLDRSGVRRAWDVIIAGGDFTGGQLYLKDMKVRCPLRPGDLVAFDGTAQRHKIETFSGRVRLSHVYFLHQSVLTEFGIDDKFEDLYLSDLKDRISLYSRKVPSQTRPIPPPDRPW